MSPAELVLLTANAVYGTAYVAMRPAVDAVGSVTLAFLRLAIACAILAPIGLRSRSAGAASLSGVDRRALFYLNVQPLVGALLGVMWLGEPLSVFTVAGGALVVLGLWIAVTARPASG